MRLFYLINSWAGRSEWLDTSLRFFYVGALPLLATALAALIFLAPHRREISRLRVGAAALGALVLCIGLMAFVPWFQKQFLGGSPISPRPFMTHWVTALVVEANDNSFPCYEVMLAAATATLLWAIMPAYGVAAWCAVFLLAFSRTFCGMNYLGDSVAGAVLGAALSTLALALARVRLQLPSVNGNPHRLTWRVRHQGALSVLALAGFFVFAFISLYNSPAHSAKFRGLWKNSEANAAPVAIASPEPEPEAAGSVKVSSAPLPTGIGESEGGVLAAGGAGMVAPGESLLSSRAARLDGHLPQAENLIKTALEQLSLPHRIVGVNVAQVKAGNSGYRVAAIRFEIKDEGAAARRRATETAVAFFKRAFHADGQLQHIDIIGVSSGRVKANRSSLSQTALKAQSVHGGARPAFTASIGRNNLILKNKPAGKNWEKLDPGMWLRARSLLYIDTQILPAVSSVAPVVKPVVPKPIAPKPASKKPVVRRTVKKRPLIKKRATMRRTRKRVLRTRRYRTRRYIRRYYNRR